MTQDDAKRVKAWLYSIRKTEMALENLKQAVKELDTRRTSPPTWMRVPDVVMVSGGQSESKQESWVQFCEDYPARRSYLDDKIKQHEEKLRKYHATVDELLKDKQWGKLHADIIRLKYYNHVRPDKAIYTMFLFCSPETFYRAHRHALQFFFDVLPDQFIPPERLTVS